MSRARPTFPKQTFLPLKVDIEAKLLVPHIPSNQQTTKSHLVVLTLPLASSIGSWKMIAGCAVIGTPQAVLFS